MSFGGVLGIGEDLYPLPWSGLDSDIVKCGYLADRCVCYEALFAFGIVFCSEAELCAVAIDGGISRIPR